MHLLQNGLINRSSARFSLQVLQTASGPIPLEQNTALVLRLQLE